MSPTDPHVPRGPMLSRRRGLALGAGLALALLASGPASAFVLSDRDRLDIARIEKYLNGITTLRSRFVQTEQDGRALEGMLYLQRPGKLRFKFVPEGPYEIIADGTRLNYIGNGALTQVSIGATPLSVLVARHIDLQETLTIVGMRHEPGAISIDLVQKSNPKGERLTILFADHPLQLKRWSITYKNGHTVTVGLYNTETDVKLDPKIFEFTPPGPQQQQTY